jgi:hypothetical protein
MRQQDLRKSSCRCSDVERDPAGDCNAERTERPLELGFATQRPGAPQRDARAQTDGRRRILHRESVDQHTTVSNDVFEIPNVGIAFSDCSMERSETCPLRHGKLGLSSATLLTVDR